MTDAPAWASLLAPPPDEFSAQPRRIADLCVQLLDITGAGISMATDSGNRASIAATDDVSAVIDELQFSLGEGPCVDAVATGVPVLLPDLSALHGVTVHRWPMFLTQAAVQGVRALFAFPLRIGAITVGALMLYRVSAGELGNEQLRGALLAADAAALALLHLHDGGEQFTDDAGTRSSYHFEVHQATGMVQVQMDVTTQQAFLMLRARAFASGRSVAAIAGDVVQRRLSFAQEES